MLFNRNFAFFQFLVNLPCYSMGILHFSQFSLIFYVIQWESCNFSLFCKFSMLFNGKLVFCQFPMLFNGNLRLEKLWGGCTYGRTDGRMDVWKFTTGHWTFGATAQKDTGAKQLNHETQPKDSISNNLDQIKRQWKVPYKSGKWALSSWRRDAN